MNRSPRTDPALSEDGNPFASRWVRPGAISYVFPPGVDAVGLAAQLARHGYWGEVLGPHGSGKSSLLCVLCEALRQTNRRVELYTLCAGQRQLTFRQGQPADWVGETQVVVDGYEQLGWRQRRRLQRLCRRHGAGLLIAVHRSAGLPLLCRTQPCLATAQQIVAGLLQAEARVIRSEDVERCYANRNGNLRDALFDLYDLWEQRRR